MWNATHAASLYRDLFDGRISSQVCPVVISHMFSCSRFSHRGLSPYLQSAHTGRRIEDPRLGRLH